MSGMKTKRCIHCGKDKIILLFSHDRSVSDGRSRYCKVCKVEQTKKWRRETTGTGVGKMLGTDFHELRRVRD